MSQQTQELIGDFMNCDFPNSETGVDEAVQSLENILCNAASQSLKRGKIKRRNKITNTVTKKWFDKECRLKRHAVRKLANAKRRDPTNIDIRKLFYQRLKEYQLLIKSKQNKYKLEKRKELEKAAEITDSSSFWSTLKSMPDTLEKKQIPPISQKGWLEHFKNLHDVPAKIKNPEQQDIKRESENMEKNQIESSIMQHPISNSEILLRSKLLKNKKAPFSDLVRNEMIKCCCKQMPFIFEKLFNPILNAGFFPKTWCEGLISLIFKSGTTTDPGNYRGICVSSCLGKFFCLILNQRLTDFVAENKILHPSQIGFLKENRTSDHTFTLRTLIDKYVHKHNSKIYACFVDFRKAFDSVWHEGLFYRLLSYGINGKMFQLIKNLNSKSTSKVKIDNYKTSAFSYLRGVRQGCILSPLLFNLFLNELPRSINYKETDPIILPNSEKLNTLPYADDLIIFSRSKIGL